MQEVGHTQAAQGWLQTALRTKQGTQDLYNQLQQYVQKPAFLQKLTAARQSTASNVPADVTSVPAGQDTAPTCPEARHPHEEVMQASFWEPVPDDSADEASVAMHFSCILTPQGNLTCVSQQTDLVPCSVHIQNGANSHLAKDPEPTKLAST